MNSPERIALAALAPQPWKNGAGLTRELAVEPRGASMSDFAWRISVAEVGRDAPFSAFPGIARNITLLRGAGMRLASLDAAGSVDNVVDHALARPLEPFAFSGDLALQATLYRGPCADFNVMTRRGAWSADVHVHRRAFEIADASAATLLLCVHGQWQIEAGATDHDTTWPLAADEALLWRAPRSDLWATPLSSAPVAASESSTSQHALSAAESALICVRLCHDRRP